MNELKPAEVFKFFAEINKIPRPSKKEEKMMAYLQDFARERGLECKVDAVGNVLIRKSATPGMEHCKTVILQSHMDMVCEKNREVDFDFEKDAIRTVVDGDWLRAQGTTLGADDGIGVAMELALLDAADIEHGPLECVFTRDEETGLTGAFGMKSGFMSGDILLNLDSEDEGQLYVSCAGGAGTTAEFSFVPADVPPGLEAVLLGLCLGCGYNFPPLQNDPRLALHISVVGVAEMDPEILYNLGSDTPLGVLPGLRVRVPPGVKAPVPVHSGISGKLTHQRRDVVQFRQRVQFLVDDPDRLHKRRGVRRRGQRGSVHLDVVACDGRHREAAHPLEEVEHRSGQPVGNHALPLLPDEEIFVDADGVLKIDTGVEVQSSLVQLPRRPAVRQLTFLPQGVGVQAGSIRLFLSLRHRHRLPFWLRSCRN